MSIIKNKILIFGLIMMFVFMKWWILISNNLFFTVGPDELRHLIVIQNFITENQISYPVGSAYNLYPPGFYVLMSVLIKVSGLASEYVLNLFSLFLLFSFAFIVYLTAKEFLDITHAFYILCFTLLLFPIPGPIPSRLGYFILIPLLMYLSVKFLKEEKFLYLYLFGFFGILLSIVHFGASVIIIVFLTAFAFILCVLFSKNANNILNMAHIWFISSLFPITGFFLYSCLLETNFQLSQYNPFDFYFTVALTNESFRVFLNQYSIPILIFYFIGVTVIYLLINKFLMEKNLINNLTNPLVESISSILKFCAISLFILFILNLFCSLISLTMRYFFHPEFSLPFRLLVYSTIVKYVPFGNLFDHLLSPYLNLTGIVFLLCFSFLSLSKIIRKDFNLSYNVIIIAPFLLMSIFIILSLLLPIFGLLNIQLDGILLKMNARLVYYIFLPISLLGGTYLINHFPKKRKLSLLLTIVFIFAVIFTIFNSIERYESNPIQQFGYQWAFENTPIKLDEPLIKEGYKDFDKYGYYHVTKFPEIDKINHLGFKDLGISVGLRELKNYFTFDLIFNAFNKKIKFESPFLKIQKKTLVGDSQIYDSRIYSSSELLWYKQYEKRISTLNYTLQSTEIPENFIKSPENFAKPTLRYIKKVGDKIEISYKWETLTEVDKDYKIFVHFTNPGSIQAENIVFQNDHYPQKPTSKWKVGEKIVDGPYLVSIPHSLSDGMHQIKVGMWYPKTGERIQLQCERDSKNRCIVGEIYYVASTGKIIRKK